MPHSSLPPKNVGTEAVLREMRDRAREMFDHALRECSIPRAFSRQVLYDGEHLRIGRDLYDIGSFERILVVSIGKAGHTMADAFSNILGTGLTGVIACPNTPPAQLFGFRYFIGGHPLPNEESLRAGEAILRLVAGSTPRTLAVFLISGGASAIAEKPISVDVSLGDVIETYKALVHSGAPIAEINAVRKHLSALKGGRLARSAGLARQVSVLVSDVPENSLDALASGPTMPDTTTVADCYAIAERYNLLQRFPDSVRVLFERHQLGETPKPGDAAFEHSRYTTVLSNATATNSALERALEDGFAVEIDNTCDDWDYQRAADYLLGRLRGLRQNSSRACVISGGEVTVQVRANSGTGGRNQQFALHCAQQIAGEQMTVLSAGTDGVDGNSPAAGAVVDGTTVERAQERGSDVVVALAEFNAYPLLDAIGDTVVTGPTGNNVRDLRILLAY
ncbi:MAG: glycerate kinase [Candidatus Korobacteraceae bacterium]|jgi:hydroxypyruvate reductase